MWLLVLLPLVGLIRPEEASGFFLSSAGSGIRATTPPKGRRRVSAASSATASARIDGSRSCLATSMISSDGVPAVVVSFGLTPEERLVAEEAVFRRGPTFPAGVRFVDGSAAAGDCTTIRQALLSSAGPGPTGDSPLPQVLVDAMPDGQTTTTTTTTSTTDGSSPGSTTTATTGFMPYLLLVLQSPTHVSPAEAEGGPGWLEMAIMGALDEFEAVPPAIISCVPPLTPEEGASPGSSSTLPFPRFDAALLDMPLSEVWRREARRHFEENGLFEPLKVHETDWCPSLKDVTVAMNLEMDGAWVASKTAPEGERWDTSKLVVIDGLVDESLCRDLLDLVTEPGWATTAASNSPPNHKNRDTDDNKEQQQQQQEEEEEEEEQVAREGPPEPKWERGLTDVDVEDDEEEEEEGEEDGGGRGAGHGSWGLTEDAMEWLCRDGEHPAIVELHSRLCKLYPEFAISHMPEAVMGPSTARMVANAPVYGDPFSWHIDADPSAFPPSPWRDHFGTYTNREPGMPLFATLLVYLDADWRREWDAETLFLDAPTDTGVFVRPRGGRAIMMDQDVTHRISTPSQTAARPRYSLVLKLILFSLQHHGHYLHPSLAPVPPAAAAAAAAAVASAAASPADPCISSLSALRGTKRNGDAGASSVRFGSAMTEAEAEEQVSSPLPQRPALSPALGEVEDEGVALGERDGGGDGGGSENRYQGVDTAVAAAAAAAAAASAGPLVEVRPVGAKGMGLFSTRPIAKGVAVAFYSGEVLTAEQLDDRYPDFEGSEYVMQLGPDQFLDARDPEKSSSARYANHSGRPNLVVELRPIEGDDDSTRRAGVVLGPDTDKGVALMTLRDVKTGEELTFDYGDDYFDGDDLGAVIEDGQDMQSLLGGVDWGPNTLSL